MLRSVVLCPDPRQPPSVFKLPHIPGSLIIDLTFHGKKSYPILLKTVDLCLEMSGDSINSNFGLVGRKFSCLGVLENLDVMFRNFVLCLKCEISLNNFYKN